MTNIVSISNRKLLLLSIRSSRIMCSKHFEEELYRREDLRDNVLLEATSSSSSFIRLSVHEVDNVFTILFFTIGEKTVIGSLRVGCSTTLSKRANTEQQIVDAM